MIHRQLTSSSLRRLAAFAALALVLVVSSMARAQSAQDRGRQLYNEGRALFDQGKYTEAIGKFRQADQVAPAPLLDFNIGLAYDRMGDRGNAIKYYRSYLDRAPSAQNRAAVQAKINRLQGELREEAARKAAEQKAAQEAAAKKAADEAAAKKAADDEAARKAAADAAAATAPAAGTTPPAAGASPPAADTSPPSPPTVDQPGPAEPAPAPAAGAPAPPAPDPFAATGDPELDRVSHIDVTAIRAQRGLASNPGPAEQAPAPDGAPNRPAAPAPQDDHKKKSRPLYKQWWFWVVVGVSAVILVDIATTGNNSNNAQPGTAATGAPAGPVLLRF